MPLDTDIRQAIVLATETTGTEAIGQLRGALAVVQEQIRDWNAALAAGTTATTTHIAEVATLTATEKQLKSAIDVAATSMRGFSAEAASTIIPLEKLVVTGLKFQDALDKLGKASADRLAADAERTQKAFEASVISLEAMGFAAKKLKSDLIDQSFAVGDKAAGDEAARYYQRLKEMATEAAQAARDGEATTAAARQHGTEAVAVLIAKVRQLAQEEREAAEAAAALQSALAGLDKRKHDDAAEKSYQQTLNDEAALQAHLGRMEKETADAAVQGQRAAIDARVKGTQAINDQVAAMKRAAQSAQDEKQAQLDGARAAAGAAASASLLADQKKAAADKIAAASDKEAAAAAWVTRQTTELDHVLEALAEDERTATTVVSANSDALTRQGNAAKDAAAKLQGFSSHGEMVANQSKKMSQFAMNASYAFQDMQYGIGAMANNVGLLATSAGNAFPKVEKVMEGFGGVAMIGAGVMGLAVAGDLIYQNWDKIAGLFSHDLPQNLINDISVVQEKLKDLESKTFKTKVDFMDITNAREELRKLNAEEAARDRLKSSKTEAQQSRSKGVSNAIVEHGGANDFASGYDNVVRAVQSATERAEPDWVKVLRDGIKVDRERLDKIDDPEKSAALLLDIKAREGQLQPFQDARENNARAAQSMVTQAAEGNEQQRKALADLVKANPRKFAATGVDTEAFAAGLDLAGPQHLMAEEKRKNLKEVNDRWDKEEKERKAAEKKVADDLEEGRKLRAGEFLGATKGGYEDPLEAEFFPKLEAGADVDALRNGARPGLTQKLRGRGVDEDILDRVVTAILQKAGDDALNAIAAGDQPKLVKKAATEKDKADKAHEAEVKKAADSVDQGFVNNAASWFAKNEELRARSQLDRAAGGMGVPEARSAGEFKRFVGRGGVPMEDFTLPPQMLGNYVQGRIAETIGRGGRVAPGLIGEASAVVRQRADEAFHTRKTEALGRTPMPDPAQFGALGPAGAQAVAVLSQTQAALAQTQAALLAPIMQAQQTSARAMQTALGVGGQAAQMRTRGPSASPLVRRGY